MSCGCNTYPCSCDSVQPEKIRLVRNVNAVCEPALTCPPKTCTRTDWLQGLGCCDGIDVSDCTLAVEQGAIARLCAVFRDSGGRLVDPIDPRITIKDPYNNIFLSAQSMSKEEVGKYFFLLGTDGNTKIGKWTAEVRGIVSGITVTSRYLFCILTLGSLPGTDTYGYGDTYGETYGYGDTYGNDIENGAEGFGVFAGREECGFDGVVSKDIPATGGCRTNRNEIGDGFWDGISNEETCVTPIGCRGQCMKDRAHAMARVKLKDIVPECWAFTEDEMDMYLEASLADFNLHPTFTNFTWDTLPEIALGIIAMGAQIWALMAQGLLEAGREFTITDNGINFTPPQISGYMQSTYSTLLSHYTEFRDKVKGNIKPGPGAIGTFRVLSLLPTLARLRHLRAKQII